MDQNLPKTIEISDPEEVSKLLLKKYSYDEVKVFYRDYECGVKLSNPEQYTHYCPAEKFTPMFLEFVPRYMEARIKTFKIMDDLKEEFSSYEMELGLVKNRLNYSCLAFAILLINLSAGKGAYDKLVNKLFEIEGVQGFSDDEENKECNPNEQSGDEPDEPQYPKLEAAIKVLGDFSKSVWGVTHEQFMRQLANDDIQMNTHAVSIVIKSMINAIDHLERSIENYKESDSDTHKKEVLHWATLLAEHETQFFVAAVDDPNDFFYQNQENEDIKLLSQIVKFVDYEDQWEGVNDHFQSLRKGDKALRMGYAIGRHCLNHNPGLFQTLEFFKWTGIYSLCYQKGQMDGQLFSELMNEKTLNKAVQLRQAYALSDALVEGEGTVQVTKMAYITKSFDDEITLDNLDTRETPEMVKRNLDLPIICNKEEYDPEEHVKLRIIAKNDWNRVNWETMQILDQNAEPAHVEAIVINLHGGSFNSGSSGDRYPWSKHFAIKTEYPVFSLDYRLAPANKFPAGLSDCFQVYMWLAYYSKEYLQLTFDRVIFEGDSAGGNLSMGVSALSILRGVRVPDKIIAHYPCASLSPFSFSPGLVIAVDDNQLGHHYLPTVIKNYSDSEFQAHQLASPRNYSEEVLSKYPECNFIIAENDPIRDELLRVGLKLKKAGRDVEVKIFKHCQHGFMGHAYTPSPIKLAKTAIKSAVDSMLA